MRWALVADLMRLFGVPLFAIRSSSGRFAGIWPGVRRLIIVAALLGLALSALGITLLTAAMNGVTIADVDPASVSMVLTEMAVGTAFLVRCAALAAAFALGLARRGNRTIATCAVVLGAIALASLAWSGHGVMDEGPKGALHLGADIVHLLAAGFWVGALGCLLWRLSTGHRDGGDDTHRVLAGFATLGSISVGLVFATGMVNTWLLVGPDRLFSLVRSLYGQLLLAKLALFTGMLALAGLNRFRLTPGLGAAIARSDVATATRQLRLSLMVETLAAVAVLGLVAWLGTLEPPVAMG